MLKQLKEDIQAVFARDPARIRNTLECFNHISWYFMP